MNRFKNEEGFTLIEMLVVVAIVGLLAGVVVVGIGGSRTKARDARRVADIKSLQNQLEVNYDSSSGYPASGKSNKVSNAKADLSPDKDPSGWPYLYWSPSKTPREKYELGTCIEDKKNLGSGSSLKASKCTKLSKPSSCPSDATLVCVSI